MLKLKDSLKQTHSNYGLKETLYYWSKTKEKKYFYCVPGVVKENFGKPEIELLVYSNCSYVWGDYLKKKLLYKENIHHGCSPFVYAHMMNSIELEKNKNIFILPRSDSSTFLKEDNSIIEYLKIKIESIEKCEVYSYPHDKEYWNHKGISAKIISERINDPYWQIKVNTLFRSAKNVYLPFVCSDVFYSSFCGCNVHFYECLDLYGKSYCNHIITNSYSKEDLSESFYKFDSLVREIYDGNVESDDIMYMNSRMLSLNSIETRDSMHEKFSNYNTNSNSVSRSFSFEMCGSEPFDYGIEIDEVMLDEIKNYCRLDSNKELDDVLNLI